MSQFSFSVRRTIPPEDLQAILNIGKSVNQHVRFGIEPQFSTLVVTFRYDNDAQAYLFHERLLKSHIEFRELNMC